MKRTKINQKEAEIGPIKNRKFFLPLLDSNSFSSPALVLVIAKIEKLGASLHQLKQNKTDFFQNVGRSSNAKENWLQRGGKVAMLRRSSSHDSTPFKANAER